MRPATVAVVQTAPVLFDAAATVERVASWTEDAAARFAQVVVFPEAFVGGYPKGSDFGIRLGTRSDAGRTAFEQYFDGAIDVPGPETKRLGEIAAEHGVELVVGVVERAGSTLYCTALFIGADGRLRGKHRKLVPTALERCVWGRGDGSTLEVVETPLGRIGAAICWENYMPLLRAALYEKGVELYCAPTVDDRDVWQATLRHIAVEGRCFVLSACQHLRRRDLPEDWATDLADGPDDVLIRGGSAIVDPFGDVVAGPVFGEDALLMASLGPGAITRGRFDLDVTGHYARPDVFDLRVDERDRS
ncbi:MAG: carbon-nitrogen hydrolase family protein [Planctomycetota bacterium]